MNPLRSGLNRMPKAWMAALGGLAGAFVLSGCADRMAGTSVGTGNPTEIEVAFRDDSGAPVSITGDLSVYASTQIPVEGYAPEPLVKVPVSGADRATLKAADFEALADSLWPKGSRNGDVCAFNVVVTGESRGGILKDFTWDKSENEFVPRNADPKPDVGAKTAIINGRLVPLVEFQGTVDTTNFSPAYNHFLFIYGTGYVSKVSQGRFLLPGLPQDKHQGFLIALPQKDQLLVGNDSTYVFSLTSSLESGTTSTAKSQVHDRVLLPDSLRIK